MNSRIKYEKITLPDANLTYYPKFLNSKQANSFYEIFLKSLKWEQYSIKMFGKTIAQPRLTSLYAINFESYTYSGLKLQPLNYTKELHLISSEILNLTGNSFTHCLANLYRDGKDSMGWHADDEKELGKEPIIASLSLGEQRNFQLKHKTNSQLKYSIPLEHGSLLIMTGSTQEFWKHQLPKTKKEISPRINLTFRNIL